MKAKALGGDRTHRETSQRITNLTMIVYDRLSGRWFHSDDVSAADRLIDIKRKKGLWGVVTEAIRIWKKRNPSLWQSQLIRVKGIRKTRARASGASKSLGTRYLLDIPLQVINIIRVLYPPEDLKMNKRFWRMFAKKHPEFKVPEKM